MKLPKLSIDNYQFTLVVFFLLTIAGVASYLNMPRTENPVVYIPGGVIVVIYPGASPMDMERLIADPLEESVNELDNIKKIHTSATDGLATIQVEFEWKTDADDKYDEMVRQVNSVRGQLPDDIFDMYMFQFSSTDVAMMQLAFVSETASYSELNNQSQKLKKELDKINGIRKVETMAYPKEEVRISVDMEKMAQIGISLDHVINAIGSSNANIPGGSLDIGGKNFAIKTSGSYDDLDQIRNTVINSYMGRIIYLKNIATVDFQYEDDLYYARYNGENAMFMTIKQKDGLNIFEISDEIKPVLENFRQNLDKNVKLEMVFDQSVIVDNRVSGFLFNLASGILLVGLVIFLALGFRSSIIVIIAIPLSIVIGLFFVDLYGLGIQQITIAGLVVALGLLVDNSIVIIENINRFLLMGHKPKEAAIMGTSQVGWPIVSSTVTTLLAFIPILMMPDKAGDFIRGLPVTIIATLTISLLIALTLSPMIARLVFREKKQKTGVHIAGLKKSFFQKLLQGFINGPYRKSLKFSLHNKRIIVLLAFLALIGSGFLFYYGVGISFFPSSETPQFLIRIDLPEGSSLEESDSAAEFAESVLDTIPLVSHYATNIGHGNPRVYYNLFAKNYARNYADIYVQLQNYDYEEFNALISRLRVIYNEYSGAKFSIKIFEQGVPIDAPIMIYIDGDNIDTLRNLGNLTEKLLEEQKGIINIDNQLNKSKIDLHININRDKASLFGVPIHEIDKTVRAAMTGLNISKYRDDKGNEYNIIVRLPVDGKTKVEDFDKIYVKSMSGKLLPLKQLATIEFVNSPSIIKRRNMSRTALITADVDQGYVLDDVLAPVLSKLEEYPFPDGYSYYVAGEIEARGETFGGMGIALVIAVIGIFAVLVLQFKSFVQPLIIYVSFVLAFIGVTLALYFTGYSFSFTAFIGFISLAGIVVNNAIILIDYTNALRREGKSTIEALQEAGEVRFTPIILTTFTTIGGLLPLTLRGGDMWAPLGWTIIGGLLVSTILTLIVVPVIYQIIEVIKERIGAGIQN